jgi:hypothetical protein
MNCKIAIAHGRMSTRNHLSPAVRSKHSIRHDLARLWLAQTFRDMRIIGMTRAEMAEITETALKVWCDKPPTLEKNERRTKDE